MEWLIKELRKYENDKVVRILIDKLEEYGSVGTVIVNDKEIDILRGTLFLWLDKILRERFSDEDERKVRLVCDAVKLLNYEICDKELGILSRAITGLLDCKCSLYELLRMVGLYRNVVDDLATRGFYPGELDEWSSDKKK